MADVGPSQPGSTEPISNTASARGSTNVAGLDEDVNEHDIISPDQSTQGVTVDIRIANLERTQKELVKRFDDWVEAQLRIHDVPQELSNGPTEIAISASSKAWEQLSAALIRIVERLSAIPKEMISRTRSLFNEPAGLPSGDQMPFLTRLHTCYTIFETHWQASQHLDSAMAVAYPGLSFAIASSYYLLLCAWFLDDAAILYRWCTEVVRYHMMSKPILGVTRECVRRAVPYTLVLGKPFVTFVVLLLWSFLDVMFRAF